MSFPFYRKEENKDASMKQTENYIEESFVFKVYVFEREVV